MSNNSDLFTPDIPIVNVGLLVNEEIKHDTDLNGERIYDDQKSYVHHDNNDGTVCIMYKYLKGDVNDNDNYVVKQIITLYEPGIVVENVNPYSSNRYDWYKIGTSLEIDVTNKAFNFNKVNTKKLDDDNYIIILLDTDIRNITPSVRAYRYSVSNDTYTHIESIDESSYGNGKYMCSCNPGIIQCYEKDGSVFVYKLSNYSVTGYDVTFHQEISRPDPNLSIVPGYSFVTPDCLVVGYGVPVTGGRYGLASIVVYQNTSTDSSIIQYTLQSVLDISTLKYSSINCSSESLVININGNRLSFIHFKLKWIDSLGIYVPLYNVSIADKSSENIWTLTRDMSGSAIDPTYIEATPTLGPGTLTSRVLTTLKTGEYRNISMSNDAEGEYISMWVPSIGKNNEVVTIKPFCEPISSFVRVDSVGKQSIIDSTTLNTSLQNYQTTSSDLVSETTSSN